MDFLLGQIAWEFGRLECVCVCADAIVFSVGGFSFPQLSKSTGNFNPEEIVPRVFVYPLFAHLQPACPEAAGSASRCVKSLIGSA